MKKWSAKRAIRDSFGLTIGEALVVQAVRWSEGLGNTDPSLAFFDSLFTAGVLASHTLSLRVVRLDDLRAPTF
ncbi:MAG: hypothetical protein ACT6S0_08960 [Roseateles sp.]|uniref:hypothetical protein n=1 Tax=Roseateles sp. TaxID=1971397 RepID=UPI00403574BF